MSAFLGTLLRLSLLGSVGALALTALGPLLRRTAGPAAVCWLWFVVLLRLCVPLWVTLPLPAREVPGSAEQVQEASQAPVPAVGGGTAANGPAGTAAAGGTPGTVSDSPAQPPTGETAAPAAELSGLLRAPILWTGVWGAGVLLCLGRYVLGCRRFLREAEKGARSPGPEAEALFRRLGAPRGAALWVSPAVPGPMAAGVLRPRVLLPEGVPADRLEDILRHELAHIRRGHLLLKWAAAVVTSLHWFDPVMVLVRREVGRSCELACDQAAVRGLDAARRRHYGETLLALAAPPPRGLGLVTTTLCEEKARLRERLVWLVDGKKRSAGAAALGLALSALLGGCALIGGAETASPAPTGTPGVPRETGELLAGAAAYDLGDGLTLAVPADIQEDLLVFRPGDEGWLSAPGMLIRAYEKESYEDSMADYGYESGSLFGVVRYSQEMYEQDYLAVDGGSGGLDFVGQKDGWYYGFVYPTDVQFYRSDSGTVNEDPDWGQWEHILEQIGLVPADFAARNGLEPYGGDRGMGLGGFLWEGEHLYIECHSGDYTVSLTLLLSQPAGQGDTGIWCVEGCFYNDYGNWHTVLPAGTGMTAAEHYQDLQAQADQGHRPGLLDPLQVAREWAEEQYPGMDLSFSLLEGAPAGDVSGAIFQIVGQEGTLETLAFLGGREVRPMNWSAAGRVHPVTGEADDPDAPFTGDISRALYPIIWAEGEAPDSLEGEAVRYTSEDGDQVLFLEEGGLVRVTRDGTERWYRTAYDDPESPFDRVFSLCEYCAAAQSPFTQEALDAGMAALETYLAERDWPDWVEGSMRYDPLWARYFAETYLENGRGQGTDLGMEDVLVLFCSFQVEEDDGYAFYLIPDGAGGWTVDDWGQAVQASPAG